MEVWFCNCKQTKNRPFCDGSHRNLKEEQRKADLIEPTTIEPEPTAVAAAASPAKTSTKTS